MQDSEKNPLTTSTHSNIPISKIVIGTDKNRFDTC